MADLAKCVAKRQHRIEPAFMDPGIAEYPTLIEDIDDAMASGDPERIRKATETVEVIDEDLDCALRRLRRLHADVDRRRAVEPHWPQKLRP
jgi:hypothetical protein